MRTGIIALFMLVIGIMMSPFKTSKKQIKEVDKKIDIENKNLLKDDKKILAIKKLREKVGMGLKEAKEYVDLLEDKAKSYC